MTNSKAPKNNSKTPSKSPVKKAAFRKKEGPSGPQKILDFLLMQETQNTDPNVLRKAALAASGVKSNTFVVTLSGMKKKGLIDYDKDTIRLTEDGRAKANPSAAPVDNATTQIEIRDKYKVGGKAAQLFDILLDGRVHDRTEVQRSIGCENKATFSVMICNLKKHGIIGYDKTTIQMADICFPFGRPSEK